MAAKVEKLSIVLTAKQAGELRSAVDAGDFASTSEAVRQAVNEWAERREAGRQAALQRVRELIQEGIASGIATERRSATEIHEEGMRRLAELRKANKLK